ncbi:MAG: cysteine-rich small domain-containing protein [Oscillospiraceae bacterium]|nr:cysteine-rich small domain-containing protein [Oscillospiraceae bacterium]
MEPSSKFFSNPACEYFPCHTGLNPEAFNCLFCYCPLYARGDACGGNFTYSGQGMKDCMDCHLPHIPEYYDIILAKLVE